MTALNLRRIGGSDAAAILGVSDYSTALDVYLRIVEGVDSPPTREMRVGKLFERVIGDWWAAESGHVVEWYEESIEHPKREWQRVTPDLRIVDLDGELGDVKRCRSAADRHGTPGTDEIAPYELVQLQTYMEALHSLGEPASAGRLVVHDLASDELLEYRTRRDPDFGALIVESCERFWRDHVAPKRPPAMTGSDIAREWIQRRWPRDTQPARPASLAEQRWCQEWREIDAALEQLEARRAVLRNQVREAIGEHRGLIGPFGRISNATVAATQGVDWRAVAHALGDEQRVAALAAQHTTTTRASYRRLAPYWTKEKT